MIKKKYKNIIFHKIPNLTAKSFKLLIFLITAPPIKNIKSSCLFCNICFLWKIFYAGGLIKDIKKEYYNITEDKEIYLDCNKHIVDKAENKVEK